MKTFILKNEDGKIHAFEVENSLLSRKAVTGVVEKIPGASIIKKPKLFSWFREDEFCRFQIENQTFSVQEPFGDNSRFLISAEPPGWSAQIELVESIFSQS